MDVKFITVNRSLVDTVPIADGQVIVTKDSADMFYDMHQSRKRIGPPMWKKATDEDYSAGFMVSDGTMGVFQFVTNGGSDVSVQEGSPVNFVIGKANEPVGLTKLPDTSKAGFEFIGWYEDQTFQSQKVETFPSKYPVGKTIYYASWRAL